MATSDPLAQKSDRPPIKRQAVVIVHGQGEQRPMGTIRSFVETLWTFNHQLTLKDPPEPDRDPDAPSSVRNPSWIVPDDKGGLYDVHRIACPALKTDDRRTDFYELYYADLFAHTPFATLWRWLKRLIQVDPMHVTPRMRLPWGAIWVFSFLTILAFIRSVYLISVHIGDWQSVASSIVQTPAFGLGLFLVSLFLLVRALPRLFLVSPPFLRSFYHWLGRVSHFRLIRVPLAVPYAGIYLTLIALLWSYELFWLISFVALILTLGSQLLLPYFGDAAIYLSAEVDTVESRQRIRDRGLNLLQALHDDPDTDRIIVVAHSLGTVVAYDLLHILWNRLGPTKENPPSEKVGEALADVDAFVKKAGEGKWSDKQVADYQDLQWAVFDQTRRQSADPAQPDTKPGWKVSDLVTFGSPLSSAQFLIADGPKDFAQLKHDKLLPTSPPQPFDENSVSSYSLSNKTTVAHHGSVFSTVRWTNIYDRFPRLFIHGDAISGPVTGPERFGYGIEEHDCTIRRYEGKAGTSISRWDGLARVFTHNHYWTNTNGNWADPSDQVVKLRNAVDLQAK